MIPYKFFMWSAPNLTEEEKILVAQELARIGKKECTRRFRHHLVSSMESSIIPSEVPTPTPKKTPSPPVWKTVLGCSTMLVAVFGAIWVLFYLLGDAHEANVMVKEMLFLAVFLCFIFFGSMELTVREYEWWVGRMIKLDAKTPPEIKIQITEQWKSANAKGPQ